MELKKVTCKTCNSQASAIRFARRILSLTGPVLLRRWLNSMLQTNMSSEQRGVDSSIQSETGVGGFYDPEMLATLLGKLD